MAVAQILDNEILRVEFMRANVTFVCFVQARNRYCTVEYVAYNHRCVVTGSFRCASQHDVKHAAVNAWAQNAI